MQRALRVAELLLLEEEVLLPVHPPRHPVHPLHPLHLPGALPRPPRHHQDLLHPAPLLQALHHHPLPVRALAKALQVPVQANLLPAQEAIQEVLPLQLKVTVLPQSAIQAIPAAEEILKPEKDMRNLTGLLLLQVPVSSKYRKPKVKFPSLL